MADGWLILDKPVGLGSTQGVAAVKRAIRQSGWPKVKVGHGGTLDPLASGVLPIAIGEATKLTGRLLDADKGYDFTIRFGAETSTLDAEGDVVAESELRPTAAALAAMLPRFTGPIRQTPPAFSALKVDGRRAYDLARAGEAVALAERAVTVHALDCVAGTGRDVAIPAAGDGPITARQGPATVRRASGLPSCAEEVLEEVTLAALVSKGTYVRSLARDIARALGTVGHVVMLRRTKAGPFTLADAVSLDKSDEAARAGRLQDCILPLRAGLADIPVLALTPDQARALRQGRTLFGIAGQPGLTLATLGDEPVALVDVGVETQVVRGFNPMSETRA